MRKDAEIVGKALGAIGAIALLWYAYKKRGKAERTVMEITGAGMATEHFSWSEVGNPPEGEYRDNMLRLLVYVMEPLRNRIGAIQVNSGFRTQAENDAAGGSNTSQHMIGAAIDWKPLETSVANAWNVLREMVSNNEITIDQGIVYGSPGRDTTNANFIHTSVIAEGNRSELMFTAERGGGKGPYEVW